MAGGVGSNGGGGNQTSAAVHRKSDDEFIVKMFIILIAIISLFVGIYIVSPFAIINVKHVGMVTRLGTVRVLYPGFNIIYPVIDKVDQINVGFDTDFTSKLTCISEDNVIMSFPGIYVDNEYSCNKNASCYTDIYVKYFLSDAKIKAKNDHKIVPEDGTIFKHMQEALSIACSKVKAYQTQKTWHILYPHIIDVLRKKVPQGVNVIAVRTDRPIIPKTEYRTSIQGIISSHMYVAITKRFA